MNYYQQQSALMKASDVFNQKWNLLILHQMLNGKKRFNQIAEALNFLSPTLISKRLKSLENQKVVIKKSKPQGSGFEYYLSALGKKLKPLMNYLYQWGEGFQKVNMDPNEVMIDKFLRENMNRFKVSELPMGRTIFKFHINDLNHHKNWWFIIDNQQISLSLTEPNEFAGLIFSLDSISLIQMFKKQQSIHQLVMKRQLKIIGCSHLKQTLNQWLVL